MELDEKNKILFENLLRYARFSVKDLAKLLNISKATILKRLKFLENNGYISRYDAIINWQKIPFIKKVYFVKVSEDYERFEKEITSREPVFSLVKLSGLYNYQVWCFFKTKIQEKEIEKIIKKFDCEEIEISNLIFPGVSFFDVDLKLPVPKSHEKNLNLKEIDVEVMKYMAQGHGRDSFYDISIKLKSPYDSVHYHGKNLLSSGYFNAIIAQPGTNNFTLQTTSLLIKCADNKIANELYLMLKHTKHILSNALGKENKILIHFLSQTHVEYRKTLSEILSLVKRDKLKAVSITHWDNVLLNNRYPLQYFLR